MLVCVTYEEMHKYGALFYAQFRLRHECFIERQGYDVSIHNGMEFDQYDTPAAVYLVALSSENEPLGCSRLTPTRHSSMIQDLWPELVDLPQDVFTDNTWEGTRFCIKKSLPTNVREQVCRELVIGYFEVGLSLGIDKIIGVMQPYIFRRVFGHTGCSYNFIGKTMKLPNGQEIAAASMNINNEALNNVRRKTGIFDDVIENQLSKSDKLAA